MRPFFLVAFKMEYMTTSQTTQQTILCCQCGANTPPNPANMCLGCIRTQFDISEGIPKQAYLHFCKSCERYLQPPQAWILCALESRELLAVCLKKLKGISKETGGGKQSVTVFDKVRLIDAGFIWTEPHSKRIKVKLTIQKEVLGSTILEQTFVVDFIVQYQMCDNCHRREAKDFWKAVVQIRQKAAHRKTFFYLEQLLIKHNAHSSSINIKQNHDGLDLYFTSKQDARKLVDFLLAVVPSKYKTSEQLISHDIHNNTYNYKYTFSVEISPICKDDIVCLPAKLAKSLGNIGQLVICYKVTNHLYFLDPQSLKVAEVSPTVYWRAPFASLCNSKQLTEYVVLESELSRNSAPNPQSKFTSADVYVMRSRDMGTSDAQLHCRTHLGHLLNAGDTALGFDFVSCNLNDPNFEMLRNDRIPDIILVKKNFGDKKKRHNKRNWKLKTLTKEVGGDTDALERDYDEFLDDLEEDKEYRQNINIYKDNSRQHHRSESDTGETPRIGLEEMLEDLTLDDQDMHSDSD